uniref:Uncharacterized protein n=1 Tax=Desulfovibrio sp. U5L TaxID=596152 RepID=I2Q3T5_9BACT
MQRGLAACLVSAAFLFLLAVPGALAQSAKAAGLRQSMSLSPMTPPKAFLDGYFIADESQPAFLYGPVGLFARSRTCPVAWLIEDAEKERLSHRDPKNPVFEYTLYLEQDCPDAVTHFVFLDQSAMNPKQWIEWRRQFHKNKAEPEYADTVKRLETAIAGGFPVTGELRFMLVNGELSPGSLEKLLPSGLSCPPRYDCAQGVPVN